eukprot:1336861-Pyramimonas_sp.AAC.2
MVDGTVRLPGLVADVHLEEGRHGHVGDVHGEVLVCTSAANGGGNVRDGGREPRHAGGHQTDSAHALVAGGGEGLEVHQHHGVRGEGCLLVGRRVDGDHLGVHLSRVAKQHPSRDNQSRQSLAEDITRHTTARLANTNTLRVYIPPR